MFDSFKISYDKSDKYFVFSDETGNQIDRFNCKSIIKTVANKFDKHNLFLPDVLTENSKFIKKNVGYLTRISNKYKVVLQNPSTSAFMGDLNMLLRLNNDMKQFEEDELAVTLTRLEPSIRKKVEYYVKLFIYTVLEYTLSLLSDVSEHLKDKPELSKYIVKYCVVNTFRLYEFSNFSHELILSQLDRLEKIVEKSQLIRQAIDSKVDNILKHIQKLDVNTQIINLAGGNNSDSTSSVMPKEYYFDSQSSEKEEDKEIDMNVESDSNSTSEKEEIDISVESASSSNSTSNKEVESTTSSEGMYDLE